MPSVLIALSEDVADKLDELIIQNQMLSARGLLLPQDVIAESQRLARTEGVAVANAFLKKAQRAAPGTNRTALATQCMHLGLELMLKQRAENPPDLEARSGSTKPRPRVKNTATK